MVQSTSNAATKHADDIDGDLISEVIRLLIRDSLVTDYTNVAL